MIKKPVGPDSVHLSRALSHLCGMSGVDISGPVQELVDQIGVSEKYFFILLDGMGWNLVERFPKDGFLRKNLKRKFHAVFPSTTATVLTSISTNKWPVTHGIFGWWTYIPKNKRTATVLPFEDKVTGRPLQDFGLSVEDVFPVRAVYPSYPDKSIFFYSKKIIDSVYSKYGRGGSTGIGYKNLKDAIRLAVESMESLDFKYAHMYFSEIDALIHEKGLNVDQVDELLKEIDDQLIFLRERLPENVRIVVTADHGLLNIPQENRLVIKNGDAIFDTLILPPGGEARVPVFHVKSGMHGKFEKLFAELAEGHFSLFKSEDVIKSGIFGTDDCSPEIMLRLGDYIALSDQSFILQYDSKSVPSYIGYHGGLSRDEMEIPLIVG